MQKQLTMGLIIGNRRFLLEHPAKTRREDMIGSMESACNFVVPGPDETKYVAVATSDAMCDAPFEANRHQIDGIVVSLPDFVDEQTVAETIRLSGIKVPILPQATPGQSGAMPISERRDSFCENGVECHVATGISSFAGVVFEATKRNLRWDVCRHQ